MAAAPGWTSNAEAVQSFTEDVLAVAAELALATDVAAFIASLGELLELEREGDALDVRRPQR